MVSKADVFFFDPPLHEKHVFEKVIINNLKDSVLLFLLNGAE